MAQTQSLSERSGAGHRSSHHPNMSKLVYRSRAVRRISAVDLSHITLSAQRRNRTEAITGLVLYNDNRFFQWLEGPTDGVDRVMQAIRSDPRHTDIEVLQHEPAKERRFRGWDMKLAASSSDIASLPQDAVEAPPAIVSYLRKNPAAAPTVLASLVVAAPLAEIAQEAAGLAGALDPNTASVLKTVILQKILPQLVSRRRLAPSELAAFPISPRVAELADLLIAADQAAAFQLIDELQAEWCGDMPLYSSLFEPAARALGDLWGEDICSEFDVTLGLGRMQTAARRLGAAAIPRLLGSRFEPSVLIAPEPGEIHGLGAALDSEVLIRAGWTPRCEYPVDDGALEDILAGTWFDVLDLSLSTAFRREHWLPRVTKTIASARRASRNEALMVIVGGRIFSETATASDNVGADCSSATARSVEQSILFALGREIEPETAPTPMVSMS